jgi:hypothetical protein
VRTVYDAALIVLLAILAVLLWIAWHEFGMLGRLFFGN